MSSLNSKKLLARIVEKWPAKVLSVAAAFILFVFHRMSILESRFFSAPLQLELSAELVPVSPYPRLVRVSVRGDADSIFPIVEDDIEAYIDLTKQSAEGWYRSPVQIRKKGTALGVEPLEISVDPLEISIQLDKKVRKTIPLNVNTQGNVESGFELLSYSLTPHQVTIEGPLSIVDSVSELSTDIVDLEGRNESFSVTVHILNPDSLVVIRGNGTTEFQALILPAAPTININGIPIEAKGLASRFETEPVVGSVRLEGDRELLDSFVPLPGFLSVDCSALNEPGTYTLPVLINLPEGLSVAYREPEELSLTVTLKETTAGESLPE
jgi:YbbR domain-containing protein